SLRPTAATTARWSRFRHLVMPVLFRTIYACGLRASEARLLRFVDVDIDAGVLQIRAAKGGKDRQVPVSAPLRARLADYHAHVVGRTGGEWFFPGRSGQPLTLGNIDKNFRRFLWQARISHGGRGHGPRVLSRPWARFRCYHRPVSPDRSPNPPCQSPGNGLFTVPAVTRDPQVAMAWGSCYPGRRSGRPSRFRAGSTRPCPPRSPTAPWRR